MTDSERHLIHSISELEDRIAKGTKYDLIKASGILRQLLIDSPSLLDKVNERHKERFIFRTLKVGKLEPEPVVQDGILWKPIISVNLIYPQLEEQPIFETNKHKFLSYQVFHFEGHIFTVKDVIKVAANVLGGVHFDNPRTGKDKTLLIANNMLNYSDGTSACEYAIKGISNVVIKAVEPLTKRIKETAP